MVHPLPPFLHLGYRALPVLATVLAVGAGALPLHAQESAAEEFPEDLTALPIEALMEIEIETVYAASKHEQKVTEAPASTSVVTADEIRKYGYTSLADVMRSLRGTDVTYDRNYEHLGVRGFNLPGDYNARILVLVDGLRTNDQLYDSAGMGLDFPIDIDLIERVEFIRGPGSSLYGSNAFFGVINLVTRRGADVSGVEVDAGAANYQTWRTRVSYGETLENGLDFLLSGSHYDSEGPSLSYDEFSATPSGGSTEDTDYERAYSFFSQVTYEGFRFQGVFGSRKKGIPTGSFGTVFDDSRTQTVDESSYIDLSYSPETEGPWKYLARIFHYDVYYKGDYVYDYDELGIPPFTVNKDRARGRSLGGELQCAYTGFEDHRVTLGAELRDLYQLDQSNFDDDVYLDDKRSDTIWSVYAQEEAHLTEELDLSLGLRYDHYTTFGDTVNPRLALIWTPVERSIFKLMSGRAFRAPNVYELYYHDDGETAKANPDLDPETIQTYEVVWEQYFCGRYRSSLSVFHYQIDDLITQIEDPLDALLVFMNNDEVENTGAELELEGRWDDGWRARFSLSVQDAENTTTGERLVNSPRSLTKLNFIAPLWREGLSAGVEMQYVSDRLTLQGDETDDHLLANLNLLQQELVEGVDLSLGIYNLFDERYYDPASAEHEQDSLLQDERTALLRLRARF